MTTYYIAMHDGIPIAVSEKNERHAKALAKAKLDEKYIMYDPIARWGMNVGKVNRVIRVEQL